MRIAIHPHYRSAVEALEARCEKLGVQVSTRYHGSSEWRVRVWRSHPVTFVVSSVELRAEGDVGAIIAGALDDWQAAHGSPEVWTDSELLQVAVQSGLSVERA